MKTVGLWESRGQMDVTGFFDRRFIQYDNKC